MDTFWYFIILFFAIFAVAILLLLTVRIAMEYERGVIFRLGRYVGTRGPGLYFLIPLIETATTVNMRLETYVIDKQEMLTKDSISLVVSAVVFFLVKEAKSAIIEVDNYRNAIEQFSLTALRSAIGESQLDAILGERKKVSDAARTMLDEVTETWGVESQRVEIKQVELPEGMKRAMAREAEATREKRARIIKAEGEEEASKKLVEAAHALAAEPGAIELRRLQMLAEVGAEHNSTVIVGIPTELLMAAKALSGSA